MKIEGCQRRWLWSSVFWYMTPCSLMELYLSLSDPRLHGVTSHSTTVLNMTGKVLAMNLAVTVGDGFYHDRWKTNCLWRIVCIKEGRCWNCLDSPVVRVNYVSNIVTIGLQRKQTGKPLDIVHLATLGARDKTHLDWCSSLPAPRSPHTWLRRSVLHLTDMLDCYHVIPYQQYSG